MISTSRQPPQWTVPGRNVLVAFGPGQSSQQPSTSINHQDSHIFTFQNQILWDHCLKISIDHGTFEQNPLPSRLSMNQFFLGPTPFRIKKFTNLLPLCLSEKEWNVDRFDEIVKVSNRELLSHFWPEWISKNFWKKQWLKDYWPTCTRILWVHRHRAHALLEF